MRWKRGYHYRCSDRKCHTRHTFLHPVEWYTRPKKCKWCGSAKFLKPGNEGKNRFYRDWHRDGKELDVKPCTCDGYGHVAKRESSPPHRRGSKYCMYRKNGEKRMPGDPDYRDARQDYEEMNQEDYGDVPF